MMAKLLGPFQIAIYRSADPESASATAQPPAPFAVTFEQVFAALEACPRMYIEPDGSFVWVGQELLEDGSSAAWQLDGHLYDRDERLLYVELQGICPRASFMQILTICELPLAEALVQQRRAGTTMRGEEFLALMG
jgi:hypothetical protein